MLGAQPLPGIVSLLDKRVPTCDLSPAEREGKQWCRSYGSVDVAPLQARIAELGECMWDSGYAASENVTIKRPFHDKRGIGNLILIFCGTGLQQVYHLPLWPQWRPLLEPVFAALGLHLGQVVRCLFAGMANGKHITPHHDNGVWVSRTHRVHIPVITNADVTFNVGPTFDDMHRVAFDQGCATELNNAAKHEVLNEGEFRVHLILDWVEDDLRAQMGHPIQLRRSQRVRQLRGRVEVLEEGEEEGVGGPALPAERSAALRALYELSRAWAGEAGDEHMQACVRKFYIEHLSAKQFWEEGVLELMRMRSDGSGDSASAAGAGEDEFLAQIEAAALLAVGLIDPLMENQLAAAVALSKGSEAASATAVVQCPMHKAVASTALPAPRTLASCGCAHYFIIGAQKSGTTALYSLIQQHPLAVAHARREPHFFDWKWPVATRLRDGKWAPAPQLRTLEACIDSFGSHGDAKAHVPGELDVGEEGTSALGSAPLLPPPLSARTLRCAHLASLKCAAADLAVLRPPRFAGESTPSYLLHGLPVFQRIAALAPDARLLVILRNPVARAYSHFSMTADLSTDSPELMRRRQYVLGRSFEDLVEEDLAKLDAAGMGAGECDPDRFQREYADGLTLEHGSHSYVGRGMYWAQLSLLYRVFPRSQVRVLLLEDLATNHLAQAQMRHVFHFIGVPHHDVSDTSPKNTRDYAPMNPATEARLKAFFAPHNRRLADLLGRELNW